MYDNGLYHNFLKVMIQTIKIKVHHKNYSINSNNSSTVTPNTFAISMANFKDRHLIIPFYHNKN